MYRRIALAVFTLSISVYCCAQRAPEQRWTDKNNAESYAAHMIQSAYGELGYMEVKVQFRDVGTRRIFEVEPGRIYHVKVVKILGKNDLPTDAMTSAPTVGSVYYGGASADQMNDLIDSLKSRYSRTANWGLQLDRTNAEVTIVVALGANSGSELEDWFNANFPTKK
jgi:hypothetical protein